MHEEKMKGKQESGEKYGLQRRSKRNVGGTGGAGGEGGAGGGVEREYR